MSSVVTVEDLLKGDIDNKKRQILLLEDQYTYEELQYNNLVHMIAERKAARNNIRKRGTLVIVNEYDRLFKELKVCEKEMKAVKGSMNRLAVIIKDLKQDLKILQEKLKLLEGKKKQCGQVISLEKWLKKKS